uniref:UspA domain-containing protein n=1 Tax=Aegilops tauschii subsp. strangulata TaxID=200361 RepID=A0A453AQ76_AEGTS
DDQQDGGAGRRGRQRPQLPRARVGRALRGGDGRRRGAGGARRRPRQAGRVLRRHPRRPRRCRGRGQVRGRGPAQEGRGGRRQGSPPLRRQLGNMIHYQFEKRVTRSRRLLLCLITSHMWNRLQVQGVVEVIDGEPRFVLCNAVEKHHADLLVVGSHGYGAIKRAFLGSVSDYCAHHAHCSVMIVKQPKSKK